MTTKKLLVETLNQLSPEDFDKFKLLIGEEEGVPVFWRSRLKTANTHDVVELLVETFSRGCVKVITKVLMKMSRTDLVQRLSGIDSGTKDLFQKNLPGISQDQLVYPDTIYELTELMMDLWSDPSVDVTREVLKDMNRTDLVQKLSEISSEPQGASRSLELEGCGSVVQDSSVWTKLDPEVNNADADEAPTYSLQSEAGHFECSVSGLRWVCEGNTSFKYHFCSWGGHMERMESRQYMPAGALIDISVIAGKLTEVYLPHWICIEDPKILDEFAVLHIDECGDVVEKASEVTASHVKLTEPLFSPWGTLIKMFSPKKIECNVLMYYEPNTSFLKLHVYVIPFDPALQQTVDKQELSRGYKGITKPRPDKYLQMYQGFSLTADIDTATIYPEEITLRYPRQCPNFYEVYIKNPDREFNMTLHPSSKKSEAVWTCEIRKDDHPNSGPVEAAGSLSGTTGVRAVADEKHSVDEQLSAQLHKATITSDRERIHEMLQCLEESELKEFKWNLKDSNFMFMLDLPSIPTYKLEKADMLDVVDLMIQAYSQRSVEVTRKVFKKINRNDLVQKL